MSIKLKYFCLTHRKQPEQAHLWMTVGGRNSYIPSRGWPKPENVWLPPLLNSYKRSLGSNSDKMVLWDTSPPSSQSAGFLNKVAIPWLKNSSLTVSASRATSNTSLNLVTVGGLWAEEKSDVSSGRIILAAALGNQLGSWWIIRRGDGAEVVSREILRRDKILGGDFLDW